MSLITEGRDAIIRWIKTEKIPEVLASSYEKAARLVVEPYYRKVAEKIASSGVTGLLLDLGTGPGYLPIEIARRCTEVRIIGIDLSAKLIRAARANAAKAGLSGRLDFEIGNAAGLRFRKASFDMIISTGMLHSLKAPEKVLQEIHRLLKTGGKAWIFDPAAISSLINRRKWAELLTSRDRFFLWLFKATGLHTPIRAYTRNEVIPIVEATDFRKYTIEAEPGEIKIFLEK
ncbi:MAG: class I SAM-dependent methyltransferase [Pseudomonadota bacterium]